MVPAVGGRKPLRRLKQVVFPAPFGPMSPTISPSSTARSTRLTAASPPKYFVRFCASNNAIWVLRYPLGLPCIATCCPDVTGAGVGLGTLSVRRRERPVNLPGSVIKPPGRKRIVSSIVMEKKIVSYCLVASLPRKTSGSHERNAAPKIGPQKCPRPPTKLYTRMLVAIRKSNVGGKRKRTKCA